jgi:hypothetical protein
MEKSLYNTDILEKEQSLIKVIEWPDWKYGTGDQITNFGLSFSFASPVLAVSASTTKHSFSLDKSSGKETYLPWSSLTALHYRALDELSESFNLLNPSELYSFLNDKKDLVLSLVDCKKAIEKYFGPISPIIELVSDPEDYSWKTIYLTIPDLPNFDQALANLDRLFDNWVQYQHKAFRTFVTINIL